MLVKKIRIIPNDEFANEIDEDDYRYSIKQKPNRRLVKLVPIYLYLYNFGSKRSKENLIELGEKPVVFNSDITKNSLSQIHLSIKKLGYFNNKIEYSVDTLNPLRRKKKRKKVRVNYFIQGNQPYTIGKITFSIKDTSILKDIRKSIRKTTIRPGANCADKIFKDERERMTRSMKDKGYFNFSKEYIHFELDSSIGRKKVNVVMIVDNPEKIIPTIFGKDTVATLSHEKYRINKVYINTNYTRNLDFSIKTDTTNVDGYYFIHNGDLRYKPHILLKSIFINNNELYHLSNIDYTYKRLSALRTFKFININFEEYWDKENHLNCFINLTPSPIWSFGVEFQGTHRGGNLGIGGNIYTRNKNTFKGAEVFQIKLNGGLEAQSRTTEEKENNATQGTIERINPFNTLEYGIETSLFIPELFIPKDKKKVPSYNDPKTNINLGYNYQNIFTRFERHLFNAAYRYYFRLGDNNSFIINPIDISLIRIKKTATFEEELEIRDNPILTNSYSNHFIAAGRINYVNSTQKLNSKRNFHFLSATFEGAGNLLNALSPKIGLPEISEGKYKAFDIQFAQYIKGEFDYRKYFFLSENSNIVYRLIGGIGVPLKNLDVLPFEKSFFGGGSNEQRAWTARSLGPGSMADTAIVSVIDQLGDIKLGANIEYRFDVTKLIEGAVFTDIGNIWLLNPDEKRPNANFKLNRFYKEFAIGGGFGARVDLNFFIIRLDAGFKLRNPALPLDERWFYQPKDKYNQMKLTHEMKDDPSVTLSEIRYRWYIPKVNLGISYPF